MCGVPLASGFTLNFNFQPSAVVRRRGRSLAGSTAQIDFALQITKDAYVAIGVTGSAGRMVPSTAVMVVATANGSPAVAYSMTGYGGPSGVDNSMVVSGLPPRVL